MRIATNSNWKVKLSAAALVAIAAVLSATYAVEGGYVNDPKDPGGETNRGITKKVARDAGYAGSMKELPIEVSDNIYVNEYIVQPGYLPFFQAQPAVGKELFDTGVNAGTGRASRWLQTSLNAFSNNGTSYALIAVDGRVGPATVAAYQSLEARRGKRKACELIIKAMDGLQTHHYIVTLKHMPTFQVGWMDHRVGNVRLEECKG